MVLGPLWMFLGCAGGGAGVDRTGVGDSPTSGDDKSAPAPRPDGEESAETGGSTGTLPRADVTGVEASGSAGDYTFAVTVRSDDLGCEQFADWWEVVSTDGSQLLYRRILRHSHTSEQPFTRSGSPVPVEADEQVVVRAHMSSSGYGGDARQGSVMDGFGPVTLPEGFGDDLEERAPLPDGCLY